MCGGDLSSLLVELKQRCVRPEQAALSCRHRVYQVPYGAPELACTGAKRAVSVCIHYICACVHLRVYLHVFGILSECLE